MTAKKGQPMSKKRNKPSARERRLNRIRTAFDPTMLKRICEMPERGFGEYAARYDLDSRRTWRGMTNDDFYYYVDTGAPVLFVAHLDHVQADPTCTMSVTNDGWFAASGALDDRLGAYVGLELLPKLGIKADVLLTTGEESGCSTARDFFTRKEYNWIFEFDRGGTDVVMYQYETEDLCDLVEKSGARVGTGSYSDIADLDDLGVAGFNWGVGYYDYHSKRSHAWLEDTFKMVEHFMRFYRANAATRLTHVPKARIDWRSDLGHRYGNGYWWDDVPANNRGVSRDETEPDVDGQELDGEDAYRDEDLDGELCPACEAELDSWRGCWSCGYGIIDAQEA